MKISYLIVTKNRPEELALTLNKLKASIDLSSEEVLVFIDGCKKSESIVKTFDWVNWTVSTNSLGASPARHQLYKKAKGNIFIGLDDDAHPLTPDFSATVLSEFKKNEELGIIAFQEIRGVFSSDEEALTNFKDRDSFFTNDFVGCGFAVKKEVYDATSGFPDWMTIYGEETALAFEVLDLGYSIHYNNNIAVNHRVDKKKRLSVGRNYYRFENQLSNTIKLILIYYNNPMYNLAKLLFHNFKKYALKDFRYFLSYSKVVLGLLFKVGSILRIRKAIKPSTMDKVINLRQLEY